MLLHVSELPSFLSLDNFNVTVLKIKKIGSILLILPFVSAQTVTDPVFIYNFGILFIMYIFVFILIFF